jgi:erythronate-4-phosphate dehydrogenase
MKIVADDKIPFLRGVLETMAEVVYVPGKEISNEILKDADALLIRTRTKCTEKLLKDTSVRFIGTATIGFDHIDTHYCEKNNIAWTNAPGCNSSSVHQYITAALLKIAHDHDFPLKGKTIGIVGVGNVGSKIEKMANAIGMNVLLNDPPRARKEGRKNFVLLGDVLYNSDIVTVHVPLNIAGEDMTYHLFKEKSFKKLRKGTWFINASRGEVVETQAIKKSVSSGKIRTVLDVWEDEPNIDTELMAKAFIATPHIAGYSTDGKANGTAMVVNSLCNFFGLPLKDWYPSNVPLPEKTVLSIDATGKTEYEILSEAVFQTYNIEKDDAMLRLSPSDFEKQRGNYPLRREFTSFSVKIKGGTAGVRKMLADLGFKVEY